MGWGMSARRKNWHLLSPSKFKGFSHVSLTPFIFPKTYQPNSHLSNFKMKQVSEGLSNLLRSAQLRTAESELEARSPWFKTRLFLPTLPPSLLRSCELNAAQTSRLRKMVSQVPKKNKQKTKKKTSLRHIPLGKRETISEYPRSQKRRGKKVQFSKTNKQKKNKIQGSGVEMNSRN